MVGKFRVFPIFPQSEALCPVSPSPFWYFRMSTILFVVTVGRLGLMYVSIMHKQFIRGEVILRELANEIADISTVSTVDTMAAIESLIQLIPKNTLQKVKSFVWATLVPFPLVFQVKVLKVKRT